MVSNTRPVFEKQNRVPTMYSRRQTGHWLLTFLCVTLLAARLDGAHLHLCLDGQETPGSVRLGPDATSHTGMQAPHNDVDVALGGELVAKPSKGDIKQPFALPTTSVTLRLAASRFYVATVPVASAPATSSLLLPPLRGPPASTAV